MAYIKVGGTADGCGGGAATAGSPNSLSSRRGKLLEAVILYHCCNQSISARNYSASMSIPSRYHYDGRELMI